MLLLLFFKKTKEVFTIKEQVITVWSPAGLNTAKVSWPLANHIARHTTIALVELPCMGIPRLALQADCLDRTLHTDAAILEYERKNSSPIDFCQKVSDNLAILAANAYALPDHPVVHKVENSQTVQSFPAHFINRARKKGYSVIIFDCQGVLVSPMTFFALKQANTIILVVDDPSDLAWTLINKERLVDAYDIDVNAFLATTITTSPQYYEEIQKVLKCPVLPLHKIVHALADQGSSTTAKNQHLKQEQVVTG